MADYIHEHWPLKQLFIYCTRGLNIIDYLLANRWDQIGSIIYNGPIGNSDHMFITFDVTFTNQAKINIKYSLNFATANYIEISNYIATNVHSEHHSNICQLWKLYGNGYYIYKPIRPSQKTLLIQKETDIKRHISQFKKYNRLYRKYKSTGFEKYKIAYKLENPNLEKT